MTPDLDRALRELADAQPGYIEAEQQFEGDVPEWFGSAQLRRALEATGIHWRLPFARTVVTAVRDRLELQSVTSSDDRVAGFLQESWDANQMDEESDDVTQWGLVYGECYLLVWPGEEPGTVDIDYNSPRNMRLFYDEETGKRKAFVIKAWKRADGHTRATLYYPDRIEKWVSKGKDAKEAKDFVPFHDVFREAEQEGDEPEAVWPIENEYGMVPVFHFRTQRPHGRPEHKDAWSVQSMVNKFVINLMSTNDFQGFPQRWALQDHGTSSDPDDLTDVDLGFADGDVDEVSQASLKNGPNQTWLLQNIKAVGQFDAADPDMAFLKPLRFFLESMASLTSTPPDFFMSADGGSVSGESRRVAHAPLTKKVNDRKQNFGSTWQEAWAFAAMVGLDLRELPDVSLTWAPSESYDDGDSWQVAKAKQEAGVPKKRTLLEQGYSRDDVDEWYPEEEADEVSVDVLHERVTLLGSLAEAAQKLGMAVTMGVMTDVQAQSTMAAFLAEAVLPETNQE